MSKLRKSAKGQNCTFRFPGCRNEVETVVLCHSNERGDKGMGQKSQNVIAAFGCFHCHGIYDRKNPRYIEFTPEELSWYFHRAMKETITYWIDKGILK